MASVGVVVIGRNEGECLRRCLLSLDGCKSSGVYVDSGSSDGSPGLARSLEWKVIELEPSLPFSAARGRNEGFSHLMEGNPSLEFVQFVDGDCELADGWLEHAVRQMQARPDVAMVFGQLRELHPSASIYNRLFDMGWSGGVGEVRSCGGIFMARARAFRDVGGFQAGLIAGEEPELCLRLRREGWKILKFPQLMGWHDAALLRFGQWWRRCVRCGRGYADGAALHGSGPERHYVRESRSALLWGIAMPALICSAAFSAFWAPWLLLVGAGGLTAYAWLWLRIYRYRRRSADSRRESALYAFFCVLSKLPVSIGILGYYWTRLRSPRSRHSVLAPEQVPAEPPHRART